MKQPKYKIGQAALVKIEAKHETGLVLTQEFTLYVSSIKFSTVGSIPSFSYGLTQYHPMRMESNPILWVHENKLVPTAGEVF